MAAQKLLISQNIIFHLFLPYFGINYPRINVNIMSSLSALELKPEPNSSLIMIFYLQMRQDL